MMLAVIIILTIVLISLVLMSFSFSNRSVNQVKTSSSDLKEIYKENSILRNKIKGLSYRCELLESSNTILTLLPPVSSWDQLRENLSRIDFKRILIDVFFLFSSRDKTLIYSLNIPSERYHDLLRDLSLVENMYKTPLIESNQIFITDPTIDRRLKEILSVAYYYIYLLRMEGETIGYLVTGSQHLHNSQLVLETTQLLGQHLCHLINIIFIYQELVKNKQNLENTIQSRTQELKEAVEKISQINKAKSEFVSTVAHELRTSLTSIRGFASLIYEGKLGEIPETVRQRIGRILYQVNRLVDMVNTLLDINKIESGKIEMNIEPLSAKTVIGAVVDTFMAQVQQKHIKLSLECPSDIIIFADKLYLERVISNLLNNAIKFTPEGGEIRVNVGMVDKDTVQISVKDTGIGIHPKDLPHIFKEFYYVDRPEVTNIKGTGLGLSLVKKVIDAHGGKIFVESAPNKGTKFSILIGGKRGGR